MCLENFYTWAGQSTEAWSKEMGTYDCSHSNGDESGILFGLSCIHYEKGLPSFSIEKSGNNLVVSFLPYRLEKNMLMK
jgi:hypothetical protein